MGSGFDTRMTLTNAGNLGIGTSSPQTKLHVDSSDGSGIRISRSANSTAYMQLFPAYSNVPTIMGLGAGGLHLGYNSNTAGIRIDTSNNTRFYGSVGINKNVNTSVALSVGADATSTTSYGLEVTNSTANTRFLVNGLGDSIFYKTDNGEGMRFDATSGNLLVGTTSAVSTSNSQTGAEARANGIVVGAVSGNASFIANRLSSDGDAILLRRDGTTVGSISVTGSATAYNTSSDARLKDVTGTARGLEVINELNPVAYNWKADGKADEGLIAQEVKELVPNAVVGSEADMYSMDYSKLVVHLVAGMQEQQKQMQEQQAIIEDLQTQLNKLKR